MRKVKLQINGNLSYLLYVGRDGKAWKYRDCDDYRSYTFPRAIHNLGAGHAFSQEGNVFTIL